MILSNQGQSINHPLDACREKPRQLLLFELFVAVSLSVAFFFLVKPCFTTGDPINRYIFTSGSESFYRLDQPIMGEHWNGRLGGLLLSGAMVDISVNQNGATAEQKIGRLTDAFGWYHSVWLFLLLAAIIFTLRDSLFINLGIFAGLMYDFSPISGPFFYPWDMPGAFFFTMAVLFFARRQMWPMVATICAGCFFKETVLVCALLVLFADQWKAGKRIKVFACILGVYVLGKQFLLSLLNLQAAMFSVNDAFTLHGAFGPATLFKNLAANLKVLFLPKLNSVIFTNAGTLVAALILCHGKQFAPYGTVLITFVAGMFLIAQPPGVSEVRDFMEVLPLSVILLSQWRMKYTGVNPPAGEADHAAPNRAICRTCLIPVPMTICLILICAGVAAWQYFVIYQDSCDLVTEKLGTSRNLSFPPAQTAGISLAGFIHDELQLADICIKNGLYSNALSHCESAFELNTNSVLVLNDLAWLRATAPDPNVRNGREAVDLAARACQLTKYEQPRVLGTLGAAYAEDGRFDNAIATARKAIGLGQKTGDTNVVEENKQLLQIYISHKPYHEPEVVPASH